MKAIFDYFTSDTFGFLLKLLTAVAAAAFGMLGIGTKVRNEDESLNGYGWTALVGIIVAGILAIGTSVYEFTTTAAKDKAAQAQTQQLLLAVRRGIYPLKGMNASFSLSFDQDVEGFAAYKKSLRAALPAELDCSSSSKIYYCAEPDTMAHAVLIPGTSPLFPKKGSLVRFIIEHLKPMISMFKRVAPTSPNGAPDYQFLGEFSLEFGIHEPEQWFIYYNYSTDKLGVSVVSFEVPDDVIVSSHVYSLVDFIPGFMAATVDVDFDSLCIALQRYGIGMSNCGPRVFAPLTRNLAIRMGLVQFKYPKVISFSTDPVLECAKRKYPTSFIFNDIDSPTFLGTINSKVPDLDREKGCEAITKPHAAVLD
jgi:hypothetical protein